MADGIAWADLETLAGYPVNAWVFFADDDGEPLPFEDADPVCTARLMGLVESAVGTRGVMGPTYHRLTERGRAAVAEHAAKIALQRDSDAPASAPSLGSPMPTMRGEGAAVMAEDTTALTCPVTDGQGGPPCGLPAERWPMPLGVSHIACPEHRLQFLAMLGSLLEVPGPRRT